jgi:beta-N-acetylhexosaminidase
MRVQDRLSQLGQLFMVGIPQPTLDNATRALLHELRPSGIILFRRNYTGPAALAVLCTELHSVFSTHRLLIALDHEGGRVHRVGPPFTHFPPAGQIGKTGSVTFAYRVVLAMCHELRRVRIDIDFAPVLDVLSNPANIVIGDRSFSSDPYQVALFGRALVRGLRESGVIPCGKHFPGHGGTLMDSHEDLPQDDRRREALDRIDLYPFQQAIREGIEMLMTAHVRYPTLDPEFPATISPTIITGLLRQQMHYAGVVVTDDLEMGAIVRHATVEQTVINALNAGADMMLVCHKIELALAARDRCLRALEKGTLSQQRMEEAVQRINALRHAHHSRQEFSPPPPREHEYAQLVEEILRLSA